MSKVARFARIGLALALFVVVAAGAAARGHAADTIVDTLARMGGFTIFLKGLQATGLDRTLRGPGPFTLFAPTDAAFQVLSEDGKGGIDAMFMPHNRTGLAEVLAYHVLPGKMTLDGISAVPTVVRTLEGRTIEVLLIITSVYINHYGRVQQAGVLASNGIIHVIDRVVTPKG